MDNDSLFRRADEALYYAKGSGKNRVISYPNHGKLVAAGNISTIFPISRTVGFDSLLHELKMLTINRIVSEDIEPELPIIFGQRGSGKSRLLGELAKKAKRINRKVLYLKGVAGNNRPYYALFQAFKKTLENETELIKELVDELSLSELKVVSEDIPEFETFSEYTKISDIEVADKDTVLFQGLVKVLFGLLRTGRILMIVDDAHNLDQVSLEFIDSFVAEFPASEIDLIFSLNADNREERSKNTAFLLGNISRIVQLAELQSFDMPVLQMPEIASMLGEITGLHEFPNNLLDVLQMRTGGNPMFLEELLQLILEREIIAYDGTKWVVNEFSPDDLPESLDAILEERAERLSPSEKEVLLRASIIGEAFDVRVLASMCKRSEQEVLKDLEGPRRAHIITEVKGRENEFSFHSEFTRSLFYSKHDPQALKQAHIEAAGLELDINKGRESEVYGKVARHYQQAGDWRNAAKIIAISKERSSQAKIPEATRRMLQRKAFEADMARESPLEKEDIAKAVKVMRDVKVAAQALRLYPRENENVGKAIEKSLKGIQSFFDKTEVLTFSVANDDVLINGQNPGPEDKDSRLADEFRQLISPYALQGIIFTKGLVQDELERFLILFSRKPEDVADKWEDILIEEELRHVRPDRKIYVAFGQSKVSIGNEIIQVDTAKGGVSDGDSLVAQAALDSIRKLVDEFQNESQELLEAIRENRDSSREMEKLILLLEEIAGYIPEEIKAEMAEKRESPLETDIDTIEIIDEIDEIVDEDILEEYAEKQQAFK
ncbi:MAG: AAA family ATPase, partial [bacterium]